jgi:hypothetical protein
MLLQKVFYQGFTFLEVKDNKMITSNFANQKFAWQCKRKFG